MSCAGLTLIMCMSGTVPLAVMLNVANWRCGKRARSNDGGKRVGNGAANASLLEGIGEDDILNSTA